MDSITQAPDILIYRATPTGTKEGLKLSLEMDEESSHDLVSLNIQTSIQTEPNTCNLSFAIKTEKLNIANAKFFDFKTGTTTWNIMDQLEVFVSDNPGNPYVRIFAGIVTSVSTKWNGYALTVSLNAKDYLHWLSLTKIEPKESLFEFVLRGHTSTSYDEQARLLSFSSRYQGYTFKQLIEEVLLPINMKEYLKQTQFVFLPHWDIRDVFNVLGVIDLQGTLRKRVLDQVEKAVKSKVDATQVPEEIADEKTVRRISTIKYATTTSKSELKLTDILTKKVSFESQVDQFLQQKAYRDAIASYWYHNYASFINKNYISLLLEGDAACVPFPLEFKSPIFFEGNYQSRLDLLRNLSQLSYYEIFQAPQGFVFVKPPLYNAPPTAEIRAAEIGGMERTVNSENIINSVTTQGAFVVGAADTSDLDRASSVKVPTNFPFIQGTVNILFPKKSKEDIIKLLSSSIPKAVSTDVVKPFNNLEDFKETLAATKYVTTSFSYGILHPATGEVIKKRTKLPNFENPKDEVLQEIYTSVITFLLYANKSAFEVPFFTAGVGRIVDLDATLGSSEPGPYSVAQQKIIAARARGEEVAIAISAYLKYAFGVNISDKELYQRVILPLIERSSITTTTTETSSMTLLKFEFPKEGLTLDWIYKVVNFSGVVSRASFASLTTTPSSKTRVSITVPNSLFKVKFFVSKSLKAFQTLDPKVTGEYNFLQHGIKATKIENPLIRSNEQAEIFSMFYIFKNNAGVERTTITLKTIRTDIVPGFPVLNLLDMCIYYVESLSYSITPGSDITVTITGIARRRPIWYTGTDKLDDDKKKEILRRLTRGEISDPNKSQIYIGADLPETKDPASYTSKQLVGWEYYGPSYVSRWFTEGTDIPPDFFLPWFGGAITHDAESKQPDKPSIPVSAKGIFSSTDRLEFLLGVFLEALPQEPSAFTLSGERAPFSFVPFDYNENTKSIVSPVDKVQAIKPILSRFRKTIPDTRDALIKFFNGAPFYVPVKKVSVSLADQDVVRLTGNTFSVVTKKAAYQIEVFFYSPEELRNFLSLYKLTYRLSDQDIDGFVAAYKSRISQVANVFKRYAGFEGVNTNA